MKIDNNLINGIITKKSGSEFNVIEKGTNNEHVCFIKGKIKLKDIKPLVGDNVIVHIESESEKIIIEICERLNILLRPKVANVSKSVIYVSVKDPEIDLFYVDSLLAMSMINNVIPFIVLGKCDLDTDENINKIKKIYEDCGYNIYTFNINEDALNENIIFELKNNINVLAGPSGAGKSTFINKVMGKEIIKTGEISEKSRKGKHTTRQSSLIKLFDNTFIIDTPGFLNISLENFTIEEIKNSFIEFNKYSSECKFSNCNHIDEPGCNVKKMLAKNKISHSRYESYKRIVKDKV